MHSHNKTLSKRSQSTLGQFPQRHSRKNTSQDFDRKQAERIQGRIGVGLGLGASALFTTNTQDHNTKKQKTSQVTKDARTKTLPQRHLRKWQALAPQSHTVARKGQINLSKKGKTCTATTRRSRHPLIDFSSTSRRPSQPQSSTDVIAKITKNGRSNRQTISKGSPKQKINEHTKK